MFFDQYPDILLKDPKKNRRIKEVPNRPQKPLPHDLLFSKSNFKLYSVIPQWKILKEFFTIEGKITIDDAKIIINQAVGNFKSEHNVIEIIDPVQIVADLHGQFYDLCFILDKMGSPDSTK